MKNAALALAGQDLGSPDVIRDEMDTAMGIRASLGTDADQILALAHASEDVARAQTPNPLATPSAAPSPIPSAGAIVDGIALAAFKAPTAPPPGIEVRLDLPVLLGNIGRTGANSVHYGPIAASSTESDGGLSGTTRMTTTYDAIIAGSKVTLTIQRDIQSTVTDASGATIFDQTKTYTAVAAIDGCPSTAGLAIGSLDNNAVSEASTFAGAGGRVGSHATDKVTTASTFEGRVDDTATLGGVSQDYSRHETWHRTASAAGGPESTSDGTYGVDMAGIQGGVPVADQSGLTAGDWSGSTGAVSMSGDATDQMGASTVLSAAWDYSILSDSFLVAERLWRHGRCVMISVPEYNAETDLNGGGSAVVEVGKGSTTPFQVTLKHRFGASVSASIEAELTSGKETLTPGSIPTPPGTLTYVAPNEDGKNANVYMKSTSKQGIGTFTLTFHTGGGWIIDNTSPGSTLKGQKCNGLGGEWLLQGVTKGSGVDQTVTFRVTIDGQTLQGTYAYKAISTIPYPATGVGTGPASVAVQADGSVVMTLGATNVTTTMTIAGNTQTLTVPLPGWRWAWKPGGTCAPA